MRVLFIYKGVEWLGIEYLSAVLKKAGHTTDLILDHGLDGTFYIRRQKKNFKPILDGIKKFEPGLVAISCVTNLFSWARKITSLVKEWKNVPVILGGVHPTIMPENTLTRTKADMVCMGEAENAILELVTHLENNSWENFNKLDIPNIWFKRNDEIVQNPVAPLIHDLDSLPFPDKDLFYKYRTFARRAYVIAGRGCPFHCTYCFNHQFQKLYSGKGKYTRRNSVDYVIEELQYYRKQYGITSVHFYDDVFITNKNWVLEFCEKYEKHLGLPFYCLVQPRTVDLELMKALKKAGCTYVSMGIESGDEEIRRNVLKRPMKDEHIYRAVEIIKQSGIKLITFNIFGFPRETPELMWKTYNMNLKLSPSGLFTYTFYPFPRTELMEISRQDGLLDEESLRKIYDGEGSYQAPTLLKHPHATELANMKASLPLAIKLPGYFHSYLKKWVMKKHHPTVLRFLELCSIPFYSGWESPQRFREQLSILIQSLKHGFTHPVNEHNQQFNTNDR